MAVVSMCPSLRFTSSKRGAYRAGHSPFHVVLGGRKVAIRLILEVHAKKVRSWPCPR